MKILCGVDGHDYAVQAADVASDLAARLKAELTFCMANPYLPGRGAPIYLWPENYIADVLKSAVRRASWHGVVVVAGQTWHCHSVSDSIADYAERNEIDYIVVGASDRSGLLRILRGSVSRELLSKATCPVLVVHRVRDQPAVGRRGRFRFKYLLPTLPAHEFPRARHRSSPLVV